jgi:hypothetical protein
MAACRPSATSCTTAGSARSAVGRGLRAAFVAAISVALGACSTPAASPTAVASGRAGLVIGHPDGSFSTACVAFQGAEISGEDLLRASGIPVTLDAGNALGTLVCSIAEEGCAFPDQACLCQCRGAGPCSYWAYFNWEPGSGWTYAAEGAHLHRIHNGDLDAWLWLDRSLPSDQLPLPPAEVTFASVCG